MPGQFRNYDPYAYQPTPVSNLGWGTYATNALSGAATGTTTGLAVGGPIGGVIGGLAGLGFGLGSTMQANERSRAAQEQQNALNEQLASRGLYDQVIQGYGMQAAAGEARAVSEARATAARLGLSPEAAAGLEQQARYEAAQATAQGLPGVYSAAAQMDLQRQQQVGQNFQVAQGLANNAAGPDYGAMYGGLLQAANAYAGARDAAKAAGAPSGFQQAVQDTGSQAGAAVVPPAAAGMALPVVGAPTVGMAGAAAQGAVQAATPYATAFQPGLYTPPPLPTYATPAAPAAAPSAAPAGALASVAGEGAPVSRGTAALSGGAPPASVSQAAPSGRAPYRPGRGGAAGGYPPGTMGPEIHPDTYEAVATRNIDELLNRVPLSIDVPDFQSWQQMSGRAGINADELTPELYARWISTVYAGGY